MCYYLSLMQTAREKFFSDFGETDFDAEGLLVPHVDNALVA